MFTNESFFPIAVIVPTHLNLQFVHTDIFTCHPIINDLTANFNVKMKGDCTLTGPQSITRSS